VATSALAGGCALSAQLTPAQPSGLSQQLVLRSLERAFAQLSFERFRGRQVGLEVFTQVATQPFVKAFVAARLEERGVRITKESPELTLHVFISALGTDRGETFIGIPALQTPILGVPFPEIALFKWTRNRGLTEASIYAFDGKTGAFADKLRAEVGRAKSDDFTVLIFIGFTLADVDKRVE
jgi:hypothetical protein